MLAWLADAKRGWGWGMGLPPWRR